MKHDILIVKSGIIDHTKAFESSYDVFNKFLLVHDLSQYFGSDTEIQLDLYYDVAFNANFKDLTFTAFGVDDLGTLILVKHFAARFHALGFRLFYQEGRWSFPFDDSIKLFNRLLQPLEASIMNKHLTIFK